MVVGTRVTLTATPQPGSRFNLWGGACQGSGSCEVVMNEDTHVRAAFAALPVEPKQPTLTVSGATSGSPPSCSLSTGASKVRLGRLKAGKAKQGKVTADTVAVGVRCDQAAVVTLHPVLTEKLPRKAHKHRARLRELALAPLSASVNVGETGVLSVRIPASAVRQLYGNAKERLALTLDATNANGASAASAAVSLLKAL